MRAMPELRQVQFHPDSEHENANPDLAKEPERIERRGRKDKKKCLVSYQAEERWT